MYKNAHTIKRHSRRSAGKVVRTSLTPHLISFFAVALFLIIAFGAVALFGDISTLPIPLMLLVVCVCVFIVGARAATACFGSEYVIKDDLIVANIGLASRRTVQVRRSDIRSVAMEQGIFGRHLNYGDVLIYTAATGGAEIVMRGVQDPDEIVSVLNPRRVASR